MEHKEETILREEHTETTHYVPDQLLKSGNGFHEEDPHGFSTTPGEEEKKANSFVRIAVIAGILLILYFISITIVKVVPQIIPSLKNASSYIGNIFNRKQDLEISSSKKEVRSGEAVSFTWKNNTSNTDGVYTWSYKCIDGITAEYPTAMGPKPVICDTLFPLPKNASTYSFTMFSNLKEKIDVPVNISFWKNVSEEERAAERKAELSSSLTISVFPKNGGYSDAITATSTTSTVTRPVATTTPEVVSKPPVKPEPKPTTNSNHVVYGSSPDLAVFPQGVSITDPYGFPKSKATAHDRVILIFKVMNIGDAPTGTYSFSAVLPTNVTYEINYISPVKASLKPGDSVDYVLNFGDYNGFGDAHIKLNPSKDTAAANNSLLIPINR